MARKATCCAGLAPHLEPRLFKALSDPNRLAILAHLAEGGSEMTVTDVAGCCPVDISVVSRHLGALREAGIVTAEKRGKMVFYQVRAAELADALRALADALEACCPDGPCRAPEKRR
jgi:DNA-binding transcriptional ArsR family regulator